MKEAIEFYEKRHGEKLFEYNEKDNVLRIGKQYYNVYYTIPNDFVVQEYHSVILPTNCKLLKKGTSLLSGITHAILCESEDIRNEIK